MVICNPLFGLISHFGLLKYVSVHTHRNIFLSFFLSLFHLSSTNQPQWFHIFLEEINNIKQRLSVFLQSVNDGSERASSSLFQVDFIPRVIPPPGEGQRIYDLDPYLKGHRAHLDYR